MSVSRWLGVVGGVCLGLSACSKDDLIRPPEVRYGRDQCAECGMILSDDRFAAALLVREGGAITPLLFDDIGDMLDYERSHGDMDLVDRFVHDADSRTWVPGLEAAYVRSETLHTPMGSGLAAFADPAAAQARARELGGAVLTFQEAARVRREWMQDRNREQRPAR